ncbi:hypothetical protein K466DRAFT_668479 [Polyporus arcularius HHB13444]|uniref:J domain-containing protein n=1 Tax=Polyporus arcularius HHB13444 TaxID=1314778 RepID=A0A5C3NLC9_9APHY|nr:hypothetical protein K466DRAFT_668479 [Polyporus arcularius HHB13444]
MHRIPSELFRSLRRPQCAQVFARAASTSANPYPFPTNTHPSPHQIFHLPKSATRADVKARYYDLVRIYHPDSPAARGGGVSPEAAHARFQAIASAYAVLSGKKPAASLDGADSEGFGTGSRTSYHDLSTAMWRAKQRRRAELDVGLDDRWKERLMLGAVLLAIALFVAQNYTTRTRAMAQARQQRRASTGTNSSPPPENSDESRLALDASQLNKPS